MSRNNELARETQRVLDARFGGNLSEAERQTGITRQTIAKMQHGRRVTVDIPERWASAIGEDVNRWRAFAGYAPVGIPPPADEEPYDARTYWHGLMSALRISFGVESVRVSLCGGEPDPDTPPEVLDARYERIRGVLLAERDIERVKS